MTDNSIRIAGNVIGTVSAGNKDVNISTQVTNAMIDQLPVSSESDRQDIKSLLSKLLNAVNEDTMLSPEDKADLLEQVNALVEITQTPEKENKEGIARKAKKIFDATLKALPDTAKIVEASSKLLPIILKSLGL